MKPCPRCEFMVDETKMEACPVCYTPVNAPPSTTAAPGMPGGGSPAAPVVGIPGLPVQPVQLGGGSMTAPSAIPPPSVNPNARVNLMGEVIEDAPAQAPRFVGNGAPQMQRAGSGIAAQKAKDDKRAQNATIFRAMTGVLAVLALIGGGYWYLKLRTNPKDQMKHYVEAAKNGNYKEVYNLSVLSDDLQKQYPDAKTFNDKVEELKRTYPGGDEMIKGLYTNLKFGEPETSDGETKIIGKIGSGKSEYKIEFQMRNVMGTWKVVDEGKALVGFVGAAQSLPGGGH